MHQTAEILLCLSLPGLLCVMLMCQNHDKLIDTHSAVQLLSVDTSVECKRTRRVPTQLMSNQQLSMTACLVVQDAAGLHATSKGKYQYNLTDTFLLRGTTERMERYNRCEHSQVCYTSSTCTFHV